MNFLLCHFIYTYILDHNDKDCLIYQPPVSKYFFVIADPVVNIEASATNSPEIYQPLVIQCNTVIVRGITSTVDIIWTTNNTQVRRVNNVTASSNINSSSIYNDSFIIPSLNLSDIGSVYECEVLINSFIPTTAKTDFIVPIPGTYIHSYVNVCIYFCTICILCVYCMMSTKFIKYNRT